MRTFRTARSTRPARLLAATGVALAALALTACDNGMGTRDEGSAGGSTSTSQNTGTSGTTTGAATTGGATTGGATTDQASSKTGTGTSTSGGTGTSGGGSDTAKTSPNGGTTDPWDPANRVTCNGSNTTVTAKPVSRPINHMLITVKNTGSKVCDLYYNPTVRFGEAQSAPRVMEESKPQAVVTLAPGESGYAGVLLSSADGSGGEGVTEKKVVIHFQGRKPGSDAGAPASPALPAKGVYVDNSVAVTYWQSTAADALVY
ncbi:DUF4232 domain-containing protein [Streptomyces europaeiscabiei]|uniref:DUF4232 domain-containing protein n=1 Tax=Streptomyces europaeiscabiei TaxID=146819 RepID=UPI0029B20BD7|nr:DUF4232 domain-containing protein [Streptomyces europaeiscabiei]MDX3861111.1 DUF4232 domain-containing protein [Streptomyces europaeiscabiei]MDX3873657.1 DUF4232 domain-containing protein [Streptomyces europaeiscabiei]